MPSIDEPTHYERAKFESAGRADDFLRSIDTFLAEGSTGGVETSLGHVTLVLVTSAMIAEYASKDGDPWVTETRNFEPGWYIVRQDSDGSIFGIGYGADCVFNEEGARADFAEAVIAHGDWEADRC